MEGLDREQRRNLPRSCGDNINGAAERHCGDNDRHGCGTSVGARGARKDLNEGLSYWGTKGVFNVPNAK